MLSHYKLEWSGEACLTVVFSQQIEEEANRAVTAFQAYIEALNWSWLLETLPTYGGLTLYMDPVQMDEKKLFEAIEAFETQLGLMTAGPLNSDKEPPAEDSDESVIFDIPVCYGGQFGPDLELVAAHCGETPEAVIEKHTAPTYLIYMLGFTPGFPYMGGMDETLETPRLDQPRTLIPEGAVGIAGKQTGIYPMASPGGWSLIGQTPLKLFDPLRREPALLKAGMKVRFRAISEEEFNEIRQHSASDNEGGAAL